MKKLYTMQGYVGDEASTLHANGCGCAACKLNAQDEPLQLNSAGGLVATKPRDTSGPLGLGPGLLDGEKR